MERTRQGRSADSVTLLLGWERRKELTVAKGNKESCVSLGCSQPQNWPGELSDMQTPTGAEWKTEVALGEAGAAGYPLCICS